MAYRFVYQTKINLYERDALWKAAEHAVERASRFTGASALGHAFRVDDVVYSVCTNPEADAYATRRQLEIAAFPILKRTDNGFRIRIGGRDDRPDTKWVAFAWRKHWASLTPEGAVEAFCARRARQAAIFESKANVALGLAQEAALLLEMSGVKGLDRA